MAGAETSHAALNVDPLTAMHDKLLQNSKYHTGYSRPQCRKRERCVNTLKRHGYFLRWMFRGGTALARLNQYANVQRELLSALLIFYPISPPNLPNLLFLPHNLNCFSQIVSFSAISRISKGKTLKTERRKKKRIPLVYTTKAVFVPERCWGSRKRGRFLVRGLIVW